MNFDALHKECTVFHQQNSLLCESFFASMICYLLTSGDMILLGESGMWKKADTA